MATRRLPRVREAPLDDAGVAVSPGIGFGAAGEGFVRFALVRDVKGIDAAVASIERALNVAPAR